MRYSSILLRWVIAIALFGTFATSNLFCQDKTSDPESSKPKIGGQFWYATPIATVAGSGTQVPVSFDKALGFSTYSTFTSGLDWHFKRKHNLLFILSPNQTTHSAVLNQTITFTNLIFQPGSSVAGTLRTYSYAPQYKYDIIHRPRGHLGIVAQINLLDSQGDANRRSNSIQYSNLDVNRFRIGLCAVACLRPGESRLLR
jgi:hypothetical protein